MRKPLKHCMQCERNSFNISPSPNVLLCTSLGTFRIRDLSEAREKENTVGEEGFKVPVKGKLGHHTLAVPKRNHRLFWPNTAFPSITGADWYFFS